MKKVLGMVILLGVVAVGAQYFSKGSLPFLPKPSEQRQELDRLRSEFRAAQGEFRQAGRAAGLSGIDTTGDASVALAEVDRINKELATLKDKLNDDNERRAAQLLQEEIDDFKREVDR